jgi:hypothetical protein
MNNPTPHTHHTYQFIVYNMTHNSEIMQLEFIYKVNQRDRRKNARSYACVINDPCNYIDDGYGNEIIVSKSQPRIVYVIRNDLYEKGDYLEEPCQYIRDKLEPDNDNPYAPSRWMKRDFYLSPNYPNFVDDELENAMFSKSDPEDWEMLEFLEPESLPAQPQNAPPAAPGSDIGPGGMNPEECDFI